jgi:hypothetical protein
MTREFIRLEHDLIVDRWVTRGQQVGPFVLQTSLRGPGRVFPHPIGLRWGVELTPLCEIEPTLIELWGRLDRSGAQELTTEGQRRVPAGTIIGVIETD